MKRSGPLPSLSETAVLSVGVLALIVGRPVRDVLLLLLAGMLWWMRGMISNREHDFVWMQIHPDDYHAMLCWRRLVWIISAAVLASVYLV